MHLGSLQSPSVVSQTVGGPQGNSLFEQGLTQTPWLQTCPVGQRPGASGLSMMPSQSSSRQVADLGARLDVLPALDVHAAVRALGGAAGADARHPRVAGLSAARAIEAADVEDEVVEVAVVALVSPGFGFPGRSRPAGRAHRLVLERDVVAVGIGDRLVDERGDPRRAVGGGPAGRVIVEVGLRVLRLRALAVRSCRSARSRRVRPPNSGVGADVGGEVGERAGPGVLRRLRRHARRQRTEVGVGAGDPVGRRLREIGRDDLVDLCGGERVAGSVALYQPSAFLHPPPCRTIVPLKPHCGENVPGVVCASLIQSSAGSPPLISLYMKSPGSVTELAGNPRLIMTLSLPSGWPAGASPCRPAA